MANLPPFPINYPYKAHHDHDARGRADCLSLEKGDEGKVLQISGKNICVTLPRLGLDVCGWVPEGVIDIGTTRRAGDLVYSTDLPNIIDATNAESFDIEQPHRFGKTTAAYMIGLKNAQEKLPMMPKWVGPFVNTQESCTQTVETIVAGTEKAGMLESFNYYGVSIDSIITRGSKITSANKKDFSYSLIYVIILKFATRAPEVYIGKTVDGAQRYDGHMASKKDGTTAKDAAHRASSEMYMIPICVLDAAADDDHLRLIAEQYFVNLFGSYFGKILVFDNDNEPANFQRGSGAPGQNVQTPADDGPAFISRWYSDCLHAYLFRKFAASVFEGVEWTPLCQRGSFGASRGLNWQSPLGAEPRNEKIIWTAIESNNLAVCNYTRRPIRATSSKGGSLTVLSITAPTKLEHFVLSVPENEPGPSSGDLVTVCFEIMHDGKPHPKPWARLPQICRFPDVDLANSLGVNITWVDKAGKYQKKHVQSRSAVIPRDDDIPGSLANYGSATGIIRYLQRQKLVNEEVFDSDLGLAHVKQITYHHLEQLIDIRDRDFGTEHGAFNEVTKPMMRSLRDVGDMMFRLGAHNIEGPWRVFKEGTGREDGRNQACDSCFVLKKGYYNKDSVTHRYACEMVETEDGEPPICKRCKALGRPCSWTATKWLGSDTKLFKALCPPPLDNSAIVEVEDPVLQNIVPVTAEEERDQVEAPIEEPGASAGRARGRGRGRGGRGNRGGRGGGRGGSQPRETMAQRGARLAAEQPGLAGTVEALGEVSD